MAKLYEITDLSRLELRDLAVRLNYLVHIPDVAGLLESRHLLGVLRRHSGDVDESVRSLRSAKKSHLDGNIGAYAVLNFKGDAAGMATVMPALELRRQRSELPPRLARLLRISNKVPTTGPEITVWTAQTSKPDSFVHDNPLGQAYGELVNSGAAELLYRQHVSPAEGAVTGWTIEPLDAPGWIHTAIIRAGFQLKGAGLYDDQESKRIEPARSKLYEVILPPNVRVEG